MPLVSTVTTTAGRRIANAAMIMAAVGTVVGQLHALARAQAHPDDLEESPWFAAWAQPGLRLLRPLVDWADPWVVYLTYGKVWVPVCVAFTAAAWLVYRRCRPVGALRVLWRVQLVAYVIMIISVTGDYVTPWIDQSFVVGIVGLSIIGVGGVPLGIALWRRRFRPRVTAVLLMSVIPTFVLVAQVTSLGSVLLPLMWGWALAARAHAVAPSEDSPAACLTAVRTAS